MHSLLTPRHALAYRFPAEKKWITCKRRRRKTSGLGGVAWDKFALYRKGGLRADSKHVNKVSIVGSLGHLAFPFPISVHWFFSMSTTSINHFYQGTKSINSPTYDKFALSHSSPFYFPLSALSALSPLRFLWPFLLKGTRILKRGARTEDGKEASVREE